MKPETITITFPSATRKTQVFYATDWKLNAYMRKSVDADRLQKSVIKMTK